MSKSKVARFPLEKRDGPASVSICRCGCPDSEHNPRRYGYPCRNCVGQRGPWGGITYGPGIKFCGYFSPAGQPRVTTIPPTRQDAATIAGTLAGLSESVLRDTLPIRPNVVIVVFLNETDSYATWGGGELSAWDRADANNQLDHMHRHARAWHEARQWNADHPNDPPRALPEQTSARFVRNRRRELETRMRTVDAKERPVLCGCQQRFKNQRGLSIHARFCVKARALLAPPNPGGPNG